MIYVLIGVALFILLVWLGRRARPLLQKRELRILTAIFGLMVIAGGAFTALRGGYLVGSLLASLGMGLVFSGRSGLASPSGPPPSQDDPAEAEAREILGVGSDATREEIKAAYARLIRAVHPDAGGTSGLAARLNAARDTLLKK